MKGKENAVLPSWLTKDSSSSSNSKIGKGRFYYGWVVLAVCLILITISYGIRFSFGVFFESLEQDFGWTRALTSGVFSVYMLIGALFAILGGWVADRYGAKIVFMVMGFFTLLGLLLTSQANALWHFFVSYSLLVAIGTGPTYAVATSIATRWFIQRRGLALAIVTSGVGLGSILMAPVAAYLIADYGWRTSYVAIGFIALIIMIPCSLLLKRTPGEAALSKDKQPEAVNLDSSEERSNELRDFSLLQAIRTRNFLLMIFLWVFYAFCLFMVMTHIVRHAIDLGITSMQAASIISVSGFANIPSRILMGIVSDRFGRKRAALICALLMAAAMLWLTESSSLWMLYVFAAAFGAAYGGLAPPLASIVGDTFGVRHIGVIFGVLEVGWVFGAAVGPALAGYIFDTTGRYYLAFLSGVLAALIMVVLILFLRVPTAKTRNKLSNN